MAFSDSYWQRFAQVARNIGARKVEDLILVMTAETAGTLDPRRTKWSRRPYTRPKTWGDVVNWESEKGESSGALGLNTIMRPAAQAMGLSAPEWWDIADIAAGDPKALDYAERFFNSIRAWRGVDRPFVDAVELYLANAAPGILGSKLSPETIVYSGQAAAQNPGLQGADGNVRIKDMQRALLGIATNSPQQGISAKPFLDDYASYVARTGDVYRGPRIDPVEKPIQRVDYATKSSEPYTPFDSDSVDQINAANEIKPTHPNLVFARQIVAAQDIPLGHDALLATTVFAGFIFGVRYLLRR